MTTTAPVFIRLNLPEGLEELVEGVAREVLRSGVREKAEIHTVAREFFEKLHSRRRGGEWGRDGRWMGV